MEHRTSGVSHTVSLEGLSFQVSKRRDVYLPRGRGRVPSPGGASELPRELVTDSREAGCTVW